MSPQLFYFSGTGNSQFVANQLVKAIPDAKSIPILHFLQKQEIVQ